MWFQHLKEVILFLVSAGFSYYDVETDIKLALTYYQKVGPAIANFRDLVDG